MSNYHKRYKAMKKALGWNNKKVAEVIGLTLNAVDVSTASSKTDGQFGKYAIAMIVVYEEMLKNGRIVYDKKKASKTEVEKNKCG